MNEMLNTLAKRSFKAGRVRNLTAALAIALTAVLFTSVTTIGAGAMQSMRLTIQMTKMSKADAELHFMSSGQFEALKKADFVKEAGLRMPIGFLTNSKRHNIELDVMDETEAKLVFAAPYHGQFPLAENEVLLSDRALRDLGFEPGTGMTVPISFTAHEKEYEMQMVVSGWYEAVNDQVSYMIAGTAFRDANPDIFRNTYHKDREVAGVCFSDLTAKNIIGLQKKLDDFSYSQGGNPDDMSADNYLPGIINQATISSPDLSTVAVGAVFILLFIFCGYLLIYNVFDIAVMQDIRRYGLYRTIGMSRRQVKTLINRQALWLACIGTPAGLLAGFFIGKNALPVVMSILDTQYATISSHVSPSPMIFALAGLLTAFTVFLSTRKPVRTATRIPAVEAFRYVESGTVKRSAKHSAKAANIPLTALANLGRNKRRTAFIMISLTLCISLLNCVGTAAASVDVEKQVHQMVRTDFAVLNARSMSILDGFQSRSLALSDQTIADISRQPGIKDAAAVYKNTLEDTNVTYDFGIEWDYISDHNTGVINFNEYLSFFYRGEDGRSMSNVYGMEETSIKRMVIKEGETDPHVLYEKMMNGEGVLLGVRGIMGTTDYDPSMNFLNVGDLVTVYKNGKPFMELPVLAKAVLNGDDEEIGNTTNGPSKVGGDGMFLYLPSEIYRKIYDEPVIYKYAFNVEESRRENMKAFLDDYMENDDTSINYLSAASARSSAENMKTMISLVGGIIGLIFGFAGVLNLINMLITSIITRRHEFAAMQSIGMTGRQLSTMMTFEGIYYALGAAILGIPFSLLLNMTLVRSVCSGIWLFTFQPTLSRALITCAVLTVIAAIVPCIVLRLFNRGSIVEQLRTTD